MQRSPGVWQPVDWKQHYSWEEAPDPEPEAEPEEGAVDPFGGHGVRREALGLISGAYHHHLLERLDGLAAAAGLAVRLLGRDDIRQLPLRRGVHLSGTYRANRPLGGEVII